jgi:hypothetical protein
MFFGSCATQGECYKRARFSHTFVEQNTSTVCTQNTLLLLLLVVYTTILTVVYPISASVFGLCALIDESSVEAGLWCSYHSGSSCCTHKSTHTMGCMYIFKSLCTPVCVCWCTILLVAALYTCTCACMKHVHKR